MVLNLRERARGLAREAMADIKGPNDEIADDPTRWGEPLKSWSLDELRERLEQSILAGMREALGEPDEGMIEAGALGPVSTTLTKYVWTAMARKRLEEIE